MKTTSLTKTKLIEKYVTEINKYQDAIDNLPEEDERNRVDLLSKQLVFIGRIAGELSEEYKQIYAYRKRAWAEAKIEATDNKEARAELAVADIRDEEAIAYGNMKRWNNAFESTKEQINAIKFKGKTSQASGENKDGGHW